MMQRQMTVTTQRTSGQLATQIAHLTPDEMGYLVGLDLEEDGVQMAKHISGDTERLATRLARRGLCHRTVVRNERNHPAVMFERDAVVAEALNAWIEQRDTALIVKRTALEAAAQAAAVYAAYQREQDELAARQYVVTLHYDEYHTLGSRVVWEGRGFWVAAQWAQSAAKSLLGVPAQGYVEHTADNTTYSAYRPDYAKHGQVYLLAGHVTIEERADERPATPAQPTTVEKPLTEAQHRAIAEWQRRMGGVAMWQPHFIDGVFPERSNAEAALRASVRRLVAQGRIFRELPDHRVEMIPTPPAETAETPESAADDGLPF
jgi:hypothetical protein